MSELRVSVRDLKARLSEYLRQVRQGTTVIITDHGRPVGRLTPVDQPFEERLEALWDAGLVAWNGQKPKPVTPSAVYRSERQVSDLLLAAVSLPFHPKVPRVLPGHGSFDCHCAQPLLQERLERTNSRRGAFRYFKDVLLNYPAERERWFQSK